MKNYRFKRIRRAISLTQQELNEIDETCWDAGYMKRVLRGEYSMKKMYILRCCTKYTNKLVGWAFIQKEHGYYAANYRLLGVYTVQSERRKGLAREMLKRVVTFSNKKGYYLYTRSWNKAGRSLFNSAELKHETEMNVKDEYVSTKIRNYLDSLPDMAMP